MTRISIIAATFVFLNCISSPSKTDACASAPPPNVRVDVAQESAIIVWDAANKIQHFIRRAVFVTEANDFGFLVPSPTQPSLAEANDSAFSLLEAFTKPKIIEERQYGVAWRFACSKKGPFDAAHSDVRVLESKRIAGYDVAVLEAGDAGALIAWLKKHGYDARPQLKEWVAPYLAAKWKITAFKIARNNNGTEVATSAVRMTYQTDRPFFPYREPEDQRSVAEELFGGRLLRIYFISSDRMQGTLGDGASKWPGKAVFANVLPDELRNNLAKQMNLPAFASATWWLTEFEDRASPRPSTDDVYFSLADTQSALARPPVVYHVLIDLGGWLCGAVVLVPIAIFFWRRIVGRKAN